MKKASSLKKALRLTRLQRRNQSFDSEHAMETVMEAKEKEKAKESERSISVCIAKKKLKWVRKEACCHSACIFSTSTVSLIGSHHV